MATTAALAHDLGARMIMGLNLGANRPALAAAEARQYVHTIGTGSLEALEIGNEPNVYGKIAIYRTPQGTDLARPALGLRVPGIPAGVPGDRRRRPALPLAGPALAVGPTPGPGSWVEHAAGLPAAPAAGADR